MEYSYGLSEDGKYIHTKVKGEVTREAAFRKNTEVNIFGREKGIQRCLDDLTEAHNVETVTNNYQFAYEDMKKIDMIQTARVALLVNSGDHSYDFVEVVLNNIGMNVKIFTNREAAVQFLTKN